jgi:hypothetical protein
VKCHGTINGMYVLSSLCLPVSQEGPPSTVRSTARGANSVKWLWQSIKDLDDFEDDFDEVKLRVPVATTRIGLTDGRPIGPCTNWPPVPTRRLSMKFTIQVLIESPDTLPLSVPIQTVERSCVRIEDVGLRLEEAKRVCNR